MNNEIICKAEIKYKPKKIVFIIYYIIIIAILSLGAIPRIDYSSNKSPASGNYDLKETRVKWLFSEIAQVNTATARIDGYYYVESIGYQGIAAGYDAKEFLAYKLIGKGVPVKVYNGIYRQDELDAVSPDEFKEQKQGDVIFSKSNYYELTLIITAAISLFLLSLPIIINCILSFISKRCFLTLSSSGVSGVRRKLFSTQNLDLPIDKVDNILRASTLFNKFSGGNTVTIRSASGLVKFPWVQNADEFVKATLANIEEYKQQVKDDNKNIINAVVQSAAANNSSSAVKIKELKGLLDQGLISQEEFETKRKELLEKM